MKRKILKKAIFVFLAFAMMFTSAHFGVVATEAEMLEEVCCSTICEEFLAEIEFEEPMQTMSTGGGCSGNNGGPHLYLQLPEGYAHLGFWPGSLTCTERFTYYCYNRLPGPGMVTCGHSLNQYKTKSVVTVGGIIICPPRQ
jgi:hypothetical protein